MDADWTSKSLIESYASGGASPKIESKFTHSSNCIIPEETHAPGTYEVKAVMEAEDTDLGLCNVIIEVVTDHPKEEVSGNNLMFVVYDETESGFTCVVPYKSLGQAT